MLSKTTIQQIAGAVAGLDKAIALLLSENTIIGRRTTSSATNTWKDDRGIAHYSMTKDIGSDLCGLFNARRAMAALIAPKPEPEPADEPAPHQPRFPTSAYVPEPPRSR